MQHYVQSGDSGESYAAGTVEMTLYFGDAIRSYCTGLRANSAKTEYDKFDYNTNPEPSQAFAPGVSVNERYCGNLRANIVPSSLRGAFDSMPARTDGDSNEASYVTCGLPSPYSPMPRTSRSGMVEYSVVCDATTLTRPYSTESEGEDCALFVQENTDKQEYHNTGRRDTRQWQ